MDQHAQSTMSCITNGKDKIFLLCYYTIMLIKLLLQNLVNSIEKKNITGLMSLGLFQWMVERTTKLELFLNVVNNKDSFCDVFHVVWLVQNERKDIRPLKTE